MDKYQIILNAVQSVMKQLSRAETTLECDAFYQLEDALKSIQEVSKDDSQDARSHQVVGESEMGRLVGEVPAAAQAASGVAGSSPVPSPQVAQHAEQEPLQMRKLEDRLWWMALCPSGKVSEIQEDLSTDGRHLAPAMLPPCSSTDMPRWVLVRAVTEESQSAEQVDYCGCVTPECKVRLPRQACPEHRTDLDKSVVNDCNHTARRALCDECFQKAVAQAQPGCEAQLRAFVEGLAKEVYANGEPTEEAWRAGQLLHDLYAAPTRQENQS